MRFMNWMKSGSQVLLIGALGGLLMTFWFACPLAMGIQTGHDMPCSENHERTPDCPYSICQASSPYLAGQSHADARVLQELPGAIFAPAVDWTSVGKSVTVAHEYNAPPGQSSRLFLNTHSLLI
jgi:hypothetical protein